jgi:hypothetical protein
LFPDGMRPWPCADFAPRKSELLIIDSRHRRKLRAAQPAALKFIEHRLTLHRTGLHPTKHIRF